MVPVYFVKTVQKKQFKACPIDNTLPYKSFLYAYNSSLVSTNLNGTYFCYSVSQNYHSKNHLPVFVLKEVSLTEVIDQMNSS